ncbi:MAG: Dabb family protein [Bacteroidales bacterium]|nr:Dabb family protein [Bacteroidales bacterium]
MTRNLKRRSFIETSVKGVAAAGLLTASCSGAASGSCLEGKFIHHVFFWMKEPVTQQARDKFEKALKDLVTVETIVDHHLGVPAPTDRGVIDNTYAYSLLTTFRNKADQDIYQTHPTHLKFIDDCQDLWERVVVYDSVSI